MSLCVERNWIKSKKIPNLAIDRQIKIVYNITNERKCKDKIEITAYKKNKGDEIYEIDGNGKKN